MATWSFYNKESGIFTGRTLNCRKESDADLNTLEGYEKIEGSYNMAVEMVDVKSGEVVPRDPPLDINPNDNVMARITQLEKRQTRPIRELAIDPTNTKAKEVLDNIEGLIAIQRGKLVKDEPQ